MRVQQQAQHQQPLTVADLEAAQALALSKSYAMSRALQQSSQAPITGLSAALARPGSHLPPHQQQLQQQLLQQQQPQPQPQLPFGYQAAPQQRTAPGAAANSFLGSLGK